MDTGRRKDSKRRKWRMRRKRKEGGEGSGRETGNLIWERSKMRKKVRDGNKRILKQGIRKNN